MEPEKGQEKPKPEEVPAEGGESEEKKQEVWTYRLGYHLIRPDWKVEGG